MPTQPEPTQNRDFRRRRGCALTAVLACSGLIADQFALLFLTPLPDAQSVTQSRKICGSPRFALFRMAAL